MGIGLFPFLYIGILISFLLQFAEDVYGLYGNSAVVEVVTVKRFEAPLTRKSRSILESKQIVSLIIFDLFMFT